MLDSYATGFVGKHGRNVSPTSEERGRRGIKLVLLTNDFYITLQVFEPVCYCSFENNDNLDRNILLTRRSGKPCHCLHRNSVLNPSCSLDPQASHYKRYVYYSKRNGNVTFGGRHCPEHQIVDRRPPPAPVEGRLEARAQTMPTKAQKYSTRNREQ